MNLPTNKARRAFAATLFLLAAASAVADDTVAHGVPLRRSAFSTQPVDTEALARQRGGTDGSLNDVKLNGSVSDNRASNVTTGNNVITNNALAGASGVPLVVQNSGNNVLIQSSTVINVQVR